MDRKQFLNGAVALFSAAASPAAALGNAAPHALLLKLERQSQGRLGVMALDTATGRTLSNREHERFPMCSTFKFLAVAAILARADRGSENLRRRIRYGIGDLLSYAPIARAHVKDGSMTVAALCEAAIEYSDNTAANLLLRALGGPHEVTRYARSIGDRFTRLDRNEPELNTALPGDPRDTTTPAAMVQTMRRLLLGDALAVNSRQLLLNWMRGSKTGASCLRAGLPHSWREGDKTGTGGGTNRYGEGDTRNDIAIVWPPNRAPVLIAAYLTGAQLPASRRDAVLADVAKIVAAGM